MKLYLPHRYFDCFVTPYLSRIYCTVPCVRSSAISQALLRKVFQRLNKLCRKPPQTSCPRMDQPNKSNAPYRTCSSRHTDLDFLQDSDSRPYKKTPTSSAMNMLSPIPTGAMKVALCFFLGEHEDGKV